MSLYVKVDSINARSDRTMYGSTIIEEVDITINGIENTYPAASGLVVLHLEEMKKRILKTLLDVFDMNSGERFECFESIWYSQGTNSFQHILEDFTYDEIQEKYDKWKKSKEVCKLTVEEIEEKLGYKVEIVSEHEER